MNTPKIPAYRATSAFTLIELMLVITIIAIMTGLSIPLFGNMRAHQDLDNATTSFAQVLQYLRSDALQGSRMTRLQWDSETSQVETLAEPDPLQAPGTFEPLRLQISLNRWFGDTVQISGVVKFTLNAEEPETRVNFNPDGSTSDTLIYISGENEQVYTVGIVGLTGQVMVWERPVESLYEDNTTF